MNAATRAERDAAVLIAKIRASEIGPRLPARVEFARSHAGHWQRAQGAWIWFLIDSDTGGQPSPCVGSIWPRADLRGEVTITTENGSDWSVDPVYIPLRPRVRPDLDRGTRDWGDPGTGSPNG